MDIRSEALRHARGALCAALALLSASSAGCAIERGGTADGLGAGAPSATTYPVVLAHGTLGVHGLYGSLDYFFGVPEALHRDGSTVYVTNVSSFGTAARGEALLEQVEHIVAQAGVEKVNLIGHGQGGLDARYVAAVRPELVASVTTIGTPHAGAELADVVVDSAVADPTFTHLTQLFGEDLAEMLVLLTGHHDAHRILVSLSSMTRDALSDFNRRAPAGMPAVRCGDGAASANGVRFFSWSGTSVATSPYDNADRLLVVASRYYTEASDGLTGRCSSHFGTVVRDDFPMNHLDEINQLHGVVGEGSGAEPKAVFRAHASRLRAAGL